MKNLYTIHDITADIYHSPFVQNNDEMACRFFSEQINAGDSNLQRYPDSYRLIKIGHFCPSNGLVRGDINHEQLGTARQFLALHNDPQAMADELAETASCYPADSSKLDGYLDTDESLDQLATICARLGPQQRIDLEHRIQGRIDAAEDQNQQDIEETLNPKTDLSNEAQLPKTSKKK